MSSGYGSLPLSGGHGTYGRLAGITVHRNVRDKYMYRYRDSPSDIIRMHVKHIFKHGNLPKACLTKDAIMASDVTDTYESHKAKCYGLLDWKTWDKLPTGVVIFLEYVTKTRTWCHVIALPSRLENYSQHNEPPTDNIPSSVDELKSDICKRMEQVTLPSTSITKKIERMNRSKNEDKLLLESTLASEIFSEVGTRTLLTSFMHDQSLSKGMSRAPGISSVASGQGSYRALGNGEKVHQRYNASTHGDESNPFGRGPHHDQSQWRQTHHNASTLGGQSNFLDQDLQDERFQWRQTHHNASTLGGQSNFLDQDLQDERFQWRQTHHNASTLGGQSNFLDQDLQDERFQWRQTHQQNTGTNPTSSGPEADKDTLPHPETPFDNEKYKAYFDAKLSAWEQYMKTPSDELGKAAIEAIKNYGRIGYSWEDDKECTTARVYNNICILKAKAENLTAAYSKGKALLATGVNLVGSVFNTQIVDDPHSKKISARLNSTEDKALFEYNEDGERSNMAKTFLHPSPDDIQKNTAMNTVMNKVIAVLKTLIGDQVIDMGEQGKSIPDKYRQSYYGRVFYTDYLMDRNRGLRQRAKEIIDNADIGYEAVENRLRELASDGSPPTHVTNIVEEMAGLQEAIQQTVHMVQNAVDVASMEFRDRARQTKEWITREEWEHKLSEEVQITNKANIEEYNRQIQEIKREAGNLRQEFDESVAQMSMPKQEMEEMLRGAIIELNASLEDVKDEIAQSLKTRVGRALDTPQHQQFEHQLDEDIQELEAWVNETKQTYPETMDATGESIQAVKRVINKIQSESFKEEYKNEYLSRYQLNEGSGPSAGDTTSDELKNTLQERIHTLYNTIDALTSEITEELGRRVAAEQDTEQKDKFQKSMLLLEKDMEEWRNKIRRNNPSDMHATTDSIHKVEGTINYFLDPRTKSQELETHRAKYDLPQSGGPSAGNPQPKPNPAGGPGSTPQKQWPNYSDSVDHQNTQSGYKDDTVILAPQHIFDYMQDETNRNTYIKEYQVILGKFNNDRKQKGLSEFEKHATIDNLPMYLREKWINAMFTAFGIGDKFQVGRNTTLSIDHTAPFYQFLYLTQDNVNDIKGVSFVVKHRKDKNNLLASVVYAILPRDKETHTVKNETLKKFHDAYLYKVRPSCYNDTGTYLRLFATPSGKWKDQDKNVTVFLSCWSGAEDKTKQDPSEIDQDECVKLLRGLTTDESTTYVAMIPLYVRPYSIPGTNFVVPDYSEDLTPSNNLSDDWLTPLPWLEQVTIPTSEAEKEGVLEKVTFENKTMLSMFYPIFLFSRGLQWSHTWGAQIQQDGTFTPFKVPNPDVQKGDRAIETLICKRVVDGVDPLRNYYIDMKSEQYDGTREERGVGPYYPPFYVKDGRVNVTPRFLGLLSWYKNGKSTNGTGAIKSAFNI